MKVLLMAMEKMANGRLGHGFVRHARDVKPISFQRLSVTESTLTE